MVEDIWIDATVTAQVGGVHVGQSAFTTAGWGTYCVNDASRPWSGSMEQPMPRPCCIERNVPCNAYAVRLRGHQQLAECVAFAEPGETSARYSVPIG